jgi:hypothetical protein
MAAGGKSSGGCGKILEKTRQQSCLHYYLLHSLLYCSLKYSLLVKYDKLLLITSQASLISK